jgi:hypothetical protein
MIALLNKGVLPLRVPIPRWPPPCLTSFLMSFASMSDYASSTSSNAAQGYRHPSDYQHPPASHSSGGGVSVGGIGGGGNANNHNNSNSGNSGSNNSNNSNDEFMAASVGGTQYGGLPDDVVLGGWCRLSRRSYFTKTLEWALHLCLFDQMLNRKDFKVSVVRKRNRKNERWREGGSMDGECISLRICNHFSSPVFSHFTLSYLK